MSTSIVFTKDWTPPEPKCKILGHRSHVSINFLIIGIKILLFN